jgi:hypothetical protein
VSKALARIRQAAKLRKRERFTSLFHHISVDLLRLSFFALKKNAASEVNGLARTSEARCSSPRALGTGQSLDLVNPCKYLPRSLTIE